VIIGLPKEIKDNEYRVGLTPAGVRALTDAGHRVLVETTAGAGSGFEDSLYQTAGAAIAAAADDVWADAEMIVSQSEGADRAGIPTHARRTGAIHLSASGSG